MILERMVCFSHCSIHYLYFGFHSSRSQTFLLEKACGGFNKEPDTWKEDLFRRPLQLHITEHITEQSSVDGIREKTAWIHFSVLKEQSKFSSDRKKYDLWIRIKATGATVLARTLFQSWLWAMNVTHLSHVF